MLEHIGQDDLRFAREAPGFARVYYEIANLSNLGFAECGEGGQAVWPLV